MKQTLKKYIRNGIIIQAALIFGLVSGASAYGAQPDISKGNLQKIINAELQTIVENEQLAVDELWALTDISELNADNKLKSIIQTKSKTVVDDPFLLLIDPAAARIELHENVGIGGQKLFSYMSAPFGMPKKRAISYVNQFLQIEATGYILTHQFLVLQWSVQTGLITAEKFRLKKLDLLTRIYEEQLSDKFYSDLYAERVAILLKYADVEIKDQEKWLSMLVQMRKSSGGWGKFETRVSFDGQEAVIKPGDTHTRVLNVWAISLYLQNQ